MWTPRLLERWEYVIYNVDLTLWENSNCKSTLIRSSFFMKSIQPDANWTITSTLCEYNARQKGVNWLWSFLNFFIYARLTQGSWVNSSSKYSALSILVNPPKEPMLIVFLRKSSAFCDYACDLRELAQNIQIHRGG